MISKNKIKISRYISTCGIFFTIITGTCIADSNTQLSDSLQKSLQSQGWHEQRTTDGSVIYRQPGSTSTRDNIQSPPSNLQKNQLGDALKYRGWDANWDSDGSLILKPQVDIGDTKLTEDKSTTQPQNDLIPNLPGFEYWRIEKDPDGSLRFHPIEKAPNSFSNTQQDPSVSCEWAKLSLDNVSLPIDQWTEVNQLSKAWLNASGIQGVQVGKVRKVLRIYLVSLVEKTAPYRLVHQLAVRASDGGIVLLE
ncbi:MAG: hypothetical protein ABW139_13535 [Candidatus Thiodiazotropha sp. DIVDIV]